MQPASFAARASHALSSRLPAMLVDPTYRRFWVSGVFYYFANSTEMVTAGWAVLEMTNSPFMVGIVGFCRMFPILILGMMVGAIADRMRRTTLILMIQMLGLFVAISLSLAFLFGVANVLIVAIGTTMFGIVWATDFTTRRALVAELTDPKITSNAMSLEAMTMMSSKITAAAVAGVLLAVGGPELAYGMLAIVYLLSVSAIVRLRRLYAEDGLNTGTRVSIIGMMRSGWSAVLQIPGIKTVLLVTAVMNLLIFPYQQLIAVIAGDILEVGPREMGVLAGIDGVGALLLTSVLVFKIRPSRIGIFYISGAILGGLLVAGLAMSPYFPLSLLIHLVAGAALSAFSATQPALIVNAVPREIRARALGILSMVIGLMPFGILISGGLSSLIGPSYSIASMCLLGVSILLIVALRNREILRM